MESKRFFFSWLNSFVPVLENRGPGPNRQTSLTEFMIVKAAHFQNGEVDRLFRKFTIVSG